MTCKVCKGNMKKKRGDVELRYNEKLVIIKDVAYLQCDNCGERIYARETTARILKRLRNKSRPKYIRVPVYA